VVLGVVQSSLRVYVRVAITPTPTARSVRYGGQAENILERWVNHWRTTNTQRLHLTCPDLVDGGYSGVIATAPGGVNRNLTGVCCFWSPNDKTSYHQALSTHPSIPYDSLCRIHLFLAVDHLLAFWSDSTTSQYLFPQNTSIDPDECFKVGICGLCNHSFVWKRSYIYL